jgi:hypothetical protein
VKGACAASQISDINLKGLRDGQDMFFTSLSVEGSVCSAEGIHDLTINRQSLLPLEGDTARNYFLKLLKEKKGRFLAFSKIIQLEEGKNTITITLTDPSEKIKEKDITITRKVPKVRQISSRLKAAIFPFTEQKKSQEALRNYVYTFLTHSFEDQKRFYVLGRSELNRVLEEEQISEEALFNQERAIHLGRLMGSETVLIGDISASEEYIEIFARLVEIENSFILAEKDLYWEGGLNAGFREILDELALKFKQHLPLCEGAVTNETSGAAIINLGENESIRQGMRFLAFSESDPTFDTVTGMNLGSDTEILGFLRAREVGKESFKADVLKIFSERRIHTGDSVIAK